MKSDEVNVLLECEHKATMHVASSVFDFPDDQLWCDTCKKTVHMDKDVRKMLKVMHLCDVAKKAAEWLNEYANDSDPHTAEAQDARRLADGLDHWREQL